uniref:Ras-related protein Rab7 n=1 Tax=Oryza meridionalis TaxID=40149 RepID=A0A0E0C6Z9_9ORYZ
MKHPRSAAARGRAAQKEGSNVMGFGPGVLGPLDRIRASPSDPKTFPFILLGNKIDVDGGKSRVVSEKKAMEWCSSKGNIPYFETSAKEDRNVDSAFLSVAKLALEHERDQDIYFQTVVPDPVPEAEQRSGCAC